MTREVQRPGDTRELDLWVASFEAPAGAQLRERTIDIDGEDWVSAAVADSRGGVMVAASVGAEQVDSGSVVSFPDVMVSSLDANLVEQSRIRFGSARSDRITGLSWTASGKLLVYGMWDGPITHTPAEAWDYGGFWLVLPPDGWSTLALRSEPW